LDGKNLFHNLVEYARTFQCPPPPTPILANCATLSKRSNPPDGAEVVVSDIGHYGLITYALSYNLSDAAACASQPAQLIDLLPLNTDLLPGSASDGVTPNCAWCV
jgi:hypothetical protein